MISIEEIENIAPGVAHLSKSEHDVLYRFTLLWTLFEAQALDNEGSVRKITSVVNEIEPQVIKESWFNEQLHYFMNRYIENGKTNYRFEHLHLRKNDNRELVELVLLGKTEDIVDQLIVCLTLVFRFRNNFFHGIKWAYGLQEQFENFEQAVRLLKTCLEKFPK